LLGDTGATFNLSNSIRLKAEAETEIVLAEFPNERPTLFKLAAISGVGNAKKDLELLDVPT
jgi:hypothetical protein